MAKLCSILVLLLALGLWEVKGQEVRTCSEFACVPNICTDICGGRGGCENRACFCDFDCSGDSGPSVCSRQTCDRDSCQKMCDTLRPQSTGACGGDDNGGKCTCFYTCPPSAASLTAP